MVWCVGLESYELREGRLVVEETYRIVFEGLGELAGKIDELAGHLEDVRVLIEELADELPGGYELTPRLVKVSDPAMEGEA